MKKHYLTFFASVVFVALFVLSACAPRERNSPDPDMTRVFADAGLNLLSQRVSSRDFSLALVSPQTEENHLTLSELRGRVALLYFWTTWCPSCVAGMPSLESLHNRYKEDGLEIVAVNIRENQEYVHSFMADNGFSFPAVMDTDGRVSGVYGVQAIPTSFIIDREGYIIARLVGLTDWDSPAVHAVFRSLLR